MTTRVRPSELNPLERLRTLLSGASCTPNAEARAVYLATARSLLVDVMKELQEIQAQVTAQEADLARSARATVVEQKDFRTDNGQVTPT